MATIVRLDRRSEAVAGGCRKPATAISTTGFVVIAVFAAATALTATAPLAAQDLGGSRRIALESPAYRYAEIIADEAGIVAYNAKPWTVNEFRRLIRSASRQPLSAAAKTFLAVLETEIAFRPSLATPSENTAVAETGSAKSAFGEASDELALSFRAVVVGQAIFSTEAAKNDISVWTERHLIENGVYFPAPASDEHFFDIPNRFSFISFPIEAVHSADFAALLQPELKQDYRTIAPLISGTAPDWDNVTWPLTQADMYTPRRAYLTAGGAWMQACFGRDKINWGPSENLNLILSDTAALYDHLALSFVNDYFRLSSAFVSLDPWSPEPTTASGTNYDGSAYKRNAGRAWRGMAAHLLEIRPLPNLSIGLSEGYLIGADRYDPIVLANPLMVFHNWFLFEEGNSLFALETSYRPLPGIKLWAQVAIDEFATPYESDAGENSRYGANAYMAGISAAKAWGDYYFSLSGEFAQSDPWFGSHRFEWLKYLNLQRQWSYPKPDTFSYPETPIGFRYGGDARVWDIALKVDSVRWPRATLGFRSVERGYINTYGKLYVDNYGVPPGKTAIDNIWANSIKTLDVGPVERILTTYVTASYDLWRFVSVGGGLAALFYDNFRFQAGRTAFDLETNLYVKATF